MSKTGRRLLQTQTFSKTSQEERAGLGWVKGSHGQAFAMRQ